MRAALTLMKKDFMFCKQWVLAGLVLPVAVGIVLIVEKETLFSLPPVFTMLFAIFCGTEFLISRTNQEESDLFTRELIEILPITRFSQVLGRYMTTLIMIIIIGVLSAISVGMVAGYGYSGIFIAIGLALIYFAIELKLYYYFGFEPTKYTFLIEFVLTAVGVQICDTIGIKLNEGMLLEMPEWICLLVGMAVYAVSFVLSVKFWRKR